jgi:hypothetical protein
MLSPAIYRTSIAYVHRKIARVWIACRGQDLIHEAQDRRIDTFSFLGISHTHKHIYMSLTMIILVLHPKIIYFRDHSLPVCRCAMRSASRSSAGKFDLAHLDRRPQTEYHDSVPRTHSMASLWGISYD